MEHCNLISLELYKIINKCIKFKYKILCKDPWPWYGEDKLRNIIFLISLTEFEIVTQVSFLSIYPLQEISLLRRRRGTN